MYTDLDFEKIEKREFEQELHWFEEEFDSLLENKTYGHTSKEIKMGNQLFDKLSETIKKYHDERQLYVLTHTLYNIEKKHPELFKK